jgi:hypothetical protein
MTVRSFTDTSAVSLAYALGDGSDAAAFAAEQFKILPYTTESFNMSKDPKSSTAISNSRRTKGSKNTKGTAAGGATVEFGAVPFVLDMLSMVMMCDWADVDAADPTKGKFLIDSDVKKFMAVEKTVKSGTGATDLQFHERYYGTMVNDATLSFGDGELITLAMTTMSVFADYAEAAAGALGLGGSIAVLGKDLPVDYEIADSSNNLSSLVIKDAAGDPLEMTFSDASLQIQNNAREQAGLGKEFAAGVGIGKVGVTISGEVYFFDQTVLTAHMTNQRLSGEMSIDTVDGTFTLYLPNLMAQSPSNSSDGENQDYKTSLTLACEEGEVVLEGVAHDCAIAIVYVPKP